MEKNKRIGLKEEVINQVTLKDLLDLSSKAESAMLPVVNGAMSFNNKAIQQLASQAKSSIDKLSNSLRELIMNGEGSTQVDISGDTQVNPTEQAGPKAPIELPPNTNNLIGEELTESNMIKMFRKLIKEALDEKSEEVTTEPPVGAEDESLQPEPEEPKAEVPAQQKSIDLSEPFSNLLKGLDDAGFMQFKQDVIDTVESSGIADGGLTRALDAIRSSVDVDDFNEAMTQLYDFADANDVLIESEKKKVNESIDGEGNAIVNDLQVCSDNLSVGLDNLDMLYASSLDDFEKEKLSDTINRINIVQGKVSDLIGSQTKSDQPIDEDVSMTMDQIQKQPDIVNKLKQKKLDVKLVDKNNSGTTSTVSSVNTI